MTNRKLKIAIPNDNPIYQLMTENALNVVSGKNIEILSDSEKNVSKMFAKKEVDIALSNPLSYGAGFKNTDWKIIPANTLASFGYTEIGTIYFKPKLKDISKIAIVDKDNYLSLIANLMLKEKFGIEAQCENMSENDLNESWVEKFDSIIVPTGKPFDSYVKMDFGDEWELLTEQPLPIAFWVCRENLSIKDYYSSSVENLLNLFSSDYKGVKLDIRDEEDENLETSRTGKILTTWNSEIEEAINFTLEFLYYHQIFSEMPSAKIFGVENNNLDANNIESKLKSLI